MHNYTIRGGPRRRRLEGGARVVLVRDRDPLHPGLHRRDRGQGEVPHVEAPREKYTSARYVASVLVFVQGAYNKHTNNKTHTYNQFNMNTTNEEHITM